MENGAAQPSFFCRQDAGSTPTLHAHRAMNRLVEVGRVTPCALFFALQKTVVAAVGAQRTARPTFQVHGASAYGKSFALALMPAN
jgi:hypothetical protein